MRSYTRTVLRLILLGGTLTVVIVSGVVAWFVSSHRSSVGTSAQLADIELARLRARFANEQPLLDMSRREASVQAAAGGQTPLRSFHTVIFDTRGAQRLVRIDVPYWFARRFAGRDRQFVWLGQLTFLDDTEFDPEPIRLTLDELEARGPGLVADYRHADGGQFLSWVE